MHAVTWYLILSFVSLLELEENIWSYSSAGMILHEFLTARPSLVFTCRTNVLVSNSGMPAEMINFYCFLGQKKKDSSEALLNWKLFLPFSFFLFLIQQLVCICLVFCWLFFHSHKVNPFLCYLQDCPDGYFCLCLVMTQHPGYNICTVKVFLSKLWPVLISPLKFWWSHEQGCNLNPPVAVRQGVHFVWDSTWKEGSPVGYQCLQWLHSIMASCQEFSVKSTAGIPSGKELWHLQQSSGRTERL